MSWRTSRFACDGSSVSVCSSFCGQRELNSDKLLALASKPVGIDLKFELSWAAALDSGGYYNAL